MYSEALSLGRPQEMSVFTLCLLLALCGIASGLMQSMVASYTGIFAQFSLEDGASGAALKGTGGALQNDRSLG